MSNEEIVKLIQQGVDVKENQERLYMNNERFIEWVIKRYTGIQKKDFEFKDLKQQGFIGLITAANKFRFDKECKFLTYAEHWIKQSIFRYCENGGSLIRVPAYLKHLIRKYQKFKISFKSTNMRYPTDAEYCESLEITVKALRHLEKTIHQMEEFSLDAYVGSSEDNSELIDFMASDDNVEEAVAGSIYFMELHQALNKALDKLDKREKAMVICKFYQNFSYGRVSNIFHCSKQNVYERIAKAFLKILKDKQMVEELLSFMPEGYDYYKLAYNNYAEKGINEESSDFFI